MSERVSGSVSERVWCLGVVDAAQSATSVTMAILTIALLTMAHSMASTPSAIISPALAATMWMPSTRSVSLSARNLTMPSVWLGLG